MDKRKFFMENASPNQIQHCTDIEYYLGLPYSQPSQWKHNLIF